MKWISDVLTWIDANQAILIPIVVLILTSISNGLLKYPGKDASLARTFIGFVLDRLSFNVNKDSPGTLKLPGMASKPPPTKGFVTPQLLAVTLILTVIAACALFKPVPQQLLNCEESQTQWSGLVSTVGTDLSTGSWNAQSLLDSLLTTEGPAAVCAVEAVITDLTSGPPGARTAAQETQLVIAETWLASEGHAKLVTHNAK